MFKRLEHNKKIKKGFTLIELLLYMSILGVLLTSLSVFYSIVMNSKVKTLAVAEVENQALQILNFVTLYIRNSEEVINIEPGQSSSILELSHSDTSTSPITFSLSNGSISITEGTNSPTLLNNNNVIVDNLNFTNMANSTTTDLIKVEFTIYYNNSFSNPNYNYSKSFFTTTSTLKYE